MSRKLEEERVLYCHAGIHTVSRGSVRKVEQDTRL